MVRLTCNTSFSVGGSGLLCLSQDSLERNLLRVGQCAFYHSEGKLVSKPAADSCIPITWFKWIMMCCTLMICVCMSIRSSEQNLFFVGLCCVVPPGRHPLSQLCKVDSKSVFPRLHCLIQILDLRLSRQLVVGIAKGVLPHQGPHSLPPPNLEITPGRGALATWVYLERVHQVLQHVHDHPPALGRPSHPQV